MAFKKITLIRDYNWGVYPYIEFDRKENGKAYAHVAMDKELSFDIIEEKQHIADVLDGYTKMFSLAAKHAREQQG